MLILKIYELQGNYFCIKLKLKKCYAINLYLDNAQEARKARSYSYPCLIEIKFSKFNLSSLVTGLVN